jgi:tetratricopeptide (TPR) repeat protein
MQDQLVFNRETCEQAAGFSLNNGGDLDEALSWINNAISGQFYSKQTFANTQIKTAILMKQGENDEALAAIDEALPKGTVIEIHQYGRQLLTQKMNDKAMGIFKFNAKNHKGTWSLHYGMVRAYTAKGDFKSAIKHLEKALKNAPKSVSKNRVQANLDKLKKGEAL